MNKPKTETWNLRRTICEKKKKSYNQNWINIRKWNPWMDLDKNHTRMSKAVEMCDVTYSEAARICGRNKTYEISRQ